MVMVFCIITAVVLCGIPQLSMAGSSSENEKKEEKKEKNKKKGKKETESNEKAKSSNDPVGGVNKIYDGFKKGSGGVKDDADKSRKSINDSWQRSK